MDQIMNNRFIITVQVDLKNCYLLRRTTVKHTFSNDINKSIKINTVKQIQI